MRAEGLDRRSASSFFGTINSVTEAGPSLRYAWRISYRPQVRTLLDTTLKSVTSVYDTSDQRRHELIMKKLKK